MTKTLLFDCDGTLVNSEFLAFAACCAVVNETLTLKGISKEFTPSELMSRFVGKSFRGMISELALEHDFSFATGELDCLVRKEEDRVIEILSSQVEATVGINELLSNLAVRYELAVVSSSALRRLAACLKKAGQERFFPADNIFSAASSLPTPTSKPDPAIYLHALITLKAEAKDCVAVEDSVSGVLAAIGAGIKVVGYVGSYAADEQAERSEALKAAGASSVIADWGEFTSALAALND